MGDFLGGDATATVVHVYSQEAYTIRFETESGTQCVTPHKWDARAEPVELNDTFDVHYSSISPCDNVERVDDLFARYAPASTATIFLAIGCVSLHRAKRRVAEGT